MKKPYVKIITAFLTSAAIMCSSSVSAFDELIESHYVVIPGGGSVHGNEVLSGKYTYDNNENLILLIKPSAQTSLLTTSVYKSATAWNNISSHAKVHIYFSAMPSKVPFKMTHPISVEGDDFDSWVFAKTVGFNEEGKSVSINSDWYYAVIKMNTNAAYSMSDNQTAAAKMTFTHEVGHALKLNHPTQDSSIEKHIYNGYPYAVMNQGIPDWDTEVSTVPTWHDKECLKSKWGE